MAGNVLVVTEIHNGAFRKTSFEVISEGRCIADSKGGKVAALVVGTGISELSSIPAQYGADAIYMADNSVCENYNPDIFRHLVVQAAESFEAEVVLFSATTQGKDLAPRVAAKLGAGLASDCVQVFTAGDGKLEAERPVYAGKALLRVSITSDVKILSLRPNIFPIAEPDESRSAQVETLQVPEISSKITLKEYRGSGGMAVDLTEAETIVTGGRGMRDPKNFRILEDLSEALGGVVGATRAAVDAGWRPHSEQVGQTGKVVSPNLYIMCGASGAIQHWAGMSGSKCIVAINKDPNAPIMSRADYSIVGDLFEVVPAMTEAVKKLRG